jgi:RNA polymerase sigma factor (sigma-70 family)
MADRHLSFVLDHVRKLAAVQAPDPPAERDLLNRFVTRGDEAAFAALVERHAAMVFGICRRVLGHAHDAEDAFQAVFLVLARRAGSVRKIDSLGSWLHGVAYHVATNLRRDRGRRCAREASAAGRARPAGAEDAARREAGDVLDEELVRLPERFRAPLVLCYLEGKSREEAARELGWSPGTLRGRLGRGRELLRARLGRRGLALAAPVFGVALSEGGAPAGVPSGLTVSAVPVSGRAAAAATEALRAMSIAKLKAGALVLVACVLTACTAAVARYAWTARPTGAGEHGPPPGAVAAAGDRDPGGEPEAPGGVPSDRPSQPGGPDGRVTEVAVVATQHFVTDMPEGFSPAHLRVLLARLSPDLLAVEAPTNVVRPWDFAPLELARVTRPWADGRRIPMIPAGWHEPGYQAQLEEMFGDFRARGKWADYQRVEQGFQARSARQPLTCESLNGRDGHGLWRDYHAALHALYGKDTPWELWHAKVLENVLRVCRDNPGKRVVVVMGAAHGYYLLDGLAREKTVRLIPVERFFPLDPMAVATQTTPRDFLQALRLLNFPAVDPDKLGKLEACLEKVKDVPELRGDYHLFRGKLLLHRGQHAAALEEFGTVSRLGRQAVSAFDGESRLHEAGRVYASIAKQRAGDPAGARSDLEAFLAEPGVTPSTRQWAETVLASIPRPAR